ncbi:MAG: carboxypeptidase regulatory-like domain-containing protein [Xanthobacteraceae bacterium]
MKSVVMLGMTALAVMLVQGASSAARADRQGPAAQGPVTQAPAGISGQVTSQAEGAMEGVVVTAHKDGSIVSVSVTSDAKGHYVFPENRLEPGHYTLAIRAIGYDLSAPASTDVVSEKTASVDLKLDKTKNLAGQLTNAEWMMSFPGTEEQKAFLLNCTSCHTMERIARSTHNVDEWMQVVSRMMGYGAVSQPVKPQPMLDRSRAGNPEQYRQAAEYLATVNLSAVDKWPYELKTLPRPTGRATRAIVTEYDMKRQTAEPHDVQVATDGSIWYSDFGEQFISKFDPKTLKLTEYPIKTFKPDAPVGLLSLEPDKAGKFWFDTMYQGSLGNLDPKTGEIAYYPLAPQFNDVRVQLNFVGLRHDVDGKVWTKSVGTQDIFRLDIASGNWEKFHPTDALPPGRRYGIYQVISDSHNNLWMAEFDDGHLGKLDAKTLQATWYTPPTLHSRMRRLEIDDQDRITIAEYRGNKVAVFDPKTEQFTEYSLPPYTFPYRAQFDKNGELWSSTMSTDRVVRTDPKSGTSVEYLMPSDTNMRTVALDNSSNPVTFWVGSNHDHSLVKVEPLD